MANKQENRSASAVLEHHEPKTMIPKNRICLWFDKDAHEAARFYAHVSE